MTTWNNRHLPYPLLAPWTDDYRDGIFSGNVPHVMLNNGKEISLTIKYHLTSQYLKDLISNGTASYISLIACTRTFTRVTTSPSDQEEDVHVLDASAYAQELTFTPYVVAACPIEGFISEEHADEIRYINPNGFSIPTASILAIGQQTRIILEQGGSPYSVIDLVADPNLDNGIFKVDTNDNRIKIYVSPRDKDWIEAMRQQATDSMDNSALFPSIYLHAVTEALRNLEDNLDRNWTRTIRHALESHNLQADDYEILKDNALDYAQRIMEKPVGRFLTAFSNRDEE